MPGCEKLAVDLAECSQVVLPYFSVIALSCA